jgi:phosphohistidine phosphatase SixA
MFRILIFLGLLFGASAAQATEAGWALLREGGHVVLLRHAYATAAGDPANVAVDDCSTQRPLSERGRQQARKMGALFSARAERTEKVLTSQFCRCTETAALAFRGSTTETLTALDPLPEDETARKTQLDDIKKVIAGWQGSGNLVLITHLANIQALTGGSAREGEAVIVRTQDENVHVLARIVF